MKYLEDGIERKIVADDNPFTEVKAHFADAKLYLKIYVFKGENLIMSNQPCNYKQKLDVAGRKVKVDAKELCSILTEGKVMSSKKKSTSRCFHVLKVNKEEGKSYNLQENSLRGLTLPVRLIDMINLSSKFPERSIVRNQVRDVALLTKLTREGLDTNALKYI